MLAPAQARALATRRSDTSIPTCLRPLYFPPDERVAESPRVLSAAMGFRCRETPRRGGAKYNAFGAPRKPLRLTIFHPAEK